MYFIRTVISFLLLRFETVRFWWCEVPSFTPRDPANSVGFLWVTEVMMVCALSCRPRPLKSTVGFQMLVSVICVQYRYSAVIANSSGASFSPSGHREMKENEEENEEVKEGHEYKGTSFWTVGFI